MRQSLIAAAFIIGCTQPPASVDSTAAAPVDTHALTSREWRLVELEARANPTGAGDRPITLKFEGDARIAGFAGCNRYFASFSTRGDSISFGPAGATRMACSEGMDMEQAYLAALSRVVRFAIADSTLTLYSPAGPLARFR